MCFNASPLCYWHRVERRSVDSLNSPSVFPLFFNFFSNPSVTACHLPYILLRKTQRRSLKSPLSFQVNAHSSVCFNASPLCYWHRVERRSVDSLNSPSVFPLFFNFFSNPSVTACHLPYILLRKTQRRSLKSPLSFQVNAHSSVCFNASPLCYWHRVEERSVDSLNSPSVFP